MGEAFSSAGYDIWITDVDEKALATVPEAWRTSRVSAVDEEGMAVLFAGLKSDWGGLDVLCANAGIAGPTALIEDDKMGKICCTHDERGA